MNATLNTDEPLRKPEISLFMFAMFDVLGFSRWVESVGLQAVLDAYHLLIQRVVRPNEKGGLAQLGWIQGRAAKYGQWSRFTLQMILPVVMLGLSTVNTHKSISEMHSYLS